MYFTNLIAIRTNAKEDQLLKCNKLKNFRIRKPGFVRDRAKVKNKKNSVTFKAATNIQKSDELESTSAQLSLTICFRSEPDMKKMKNNRAHISKHLNRSVNF